MRTVLRVGDLVDDRSGDVVAEPVNGATVMLGRCGPTLSEHDGQVERHDVEGRTFAPHAAQVRDERGAVGPPLRPPVLGQPCPGALAHHPPEEALGLFAGIVGQRGPGAAAAAEPEPGHRRLESADGVEGARRGQCGTDDDVAAQAVPDRHQRAVALGAHGLGNGEEVVDVAAEADHAAVPRTLVPAPVVGQRGELGQPAHGQPEAVAPVERPVDEDHRAGRGARARCRCASRPRGEMEGGRIGHGQGRRYRDCP